MATVYLAHDLRHDRLVALKVLKPELGAVLGVDRFLSEIRVTANLHHPNLLPLFDSGDANGLLFYVMPYVTSESLRARLERERELPVDDAIAIATAIAGALDSAHRHGVLHRDLKPENVLMQDGQPVVADFGIALAVSNAGGTRVTQTGLSLGTPQYMSPEQAAGDRQLDARTDVYSLAAMVYEMLAGEPPHSGVSVAAVISKVLTETPMPLRQRRDSIPPRVEWAVAKALAKRPADRFAGAGEFAKALSGSGAYEAALRAGEVDGVVSHSQAPKSRRQLALMIVPWLIAAALGAAAIRQQTAPVTARGITAPIRLRVQFDSGATPNGKIEALSDGSGILFRSIVNDTARLFLRRFDRDAATVITGTEGVGAFAVSPDGRRLVFNAGTALRVVPSTGGTAQSISGSTGTIAGWIDDDRVVVAAGTDGLRVVRLSTGAISAITTTDSASLDNRRHDFAVVVDRGRHVLFATKFGFYGAPVNIGVTRTSGGEQHLLDLPDAQPLGHEGGQLIYLTAGAQLRAAPLDLSTGHLGTSTTITEGAWNASLSGVGTLLYRETEPAAFAVRVDANGVESAVDALAATGIMDPRLSPDGTRLLVQARRSGRYGVYIYDLVKRTLSPGSPPGFVAYQGRWHPDGNRFVLRYSVPGGALVRLEYADRSQEARDVSNAPNVQLAEVTPDGKSVLAVESGKVGVMPIDGGPFANLPSGSLTGDSPTISPDGHLVAYVATESGATDVYVKSVRERGGRVQVSRKGGTAPQWTRDGRLAFRDGTPSVAIGNEAAVRYMVARVHPAPALAADEPQVLLEHRGARMNWGTYTNYALRPDGRGLYVVRTVENDRAMVVVLNWAANSLGIGTRTPTPRP